MENISEPMKKENFNCKDILISLLCVLVSTCYYPIFMYSTNVQEASFKEAIPAILLFSSIAFPLFGFLLLATKNIFISTISSVTLILFVENYLLVEKFIKKLFPMLKYWHIIPLFVVIMFHIVYFLYKKMKPSAQSGAILVVTYLFSVMTAISFFTAVPSIFEKVQVNATKKEEMVSNVATEHSDLPNVYYLVFDEYSNFDMIEKYYDYDNYAFAEFLENRNFTVSYDTINEDYSTSTVVTNALNLDYLVHRTDSEVKKTELRENNELFRLLQNRGYDIIGVGDSEFVGIPSVTKEKNSGSGTEEGYSFHQLLLMQSVFYPFIQGDISDKQAVVLNALNYFSVRNNYSHDTPSFTYLYLVCPHAPFIFDQYGNTQKLEGYSNFEDKSYYLEQFIYITKEMEILVDHIVNNDPDSVIILQSDHGMRWINSNRTEEMIPIDMVKPLNAVYYRGEYISGIEGTSNVNTNRIVFGRLFNLDMPPLEVPEVYVQPNSPWYVP